MARCCGDRAEWLIAGIGALLIFSATSCLGARAYERRASRVLGVAWQRAPFVPNDGQRLADRFAAVDCDTGDVEGIKNTSRGACRRNDRGYGAASPASSPRSFVSQPGKAHRPAAFAQRSLILFCVIAIRFLAGGPHAGAGLSVKGRAGTLRPALSAARRWPPHHFQGSSDWCTAARDRTQDKLGYRPRSSWRSA